MSVSFQGVKNSYLANGVTRFFAFLFKIESGNDLKVFTVDAGVTTLVSPALYTVVKDPTEGGEVRFITAPAAGLGVFILSDTEIRQELELDNNSDLSLTQIENSLDRLTKFALEANDKIKKSIQFDRLSNTENVFMDEPIDEGFLKYNLASNRFQFEEIPLEDYYNSVQVDALIDDARNDLLDEINELDIELSQDIFDGDTATLALAQSFTNAGLLTKADLVHTHVKADITNFNEDDYATGAEGDLASTAVQPATLSAGLATKANLVHVHALSALTQSGAIDGQVPQWDDGLGQWVPANAGGGGVTDHGALTGLADDDHPQYHNDVRGDIRYNTKSEITTFLAGKANTVHTHVKADITDFNEADYATPADISNFETTAQLNTRDTNNRARANHTGTQLASTISDLAAAVRLVVLTGVSFATTTAILATDTVLQAFGKLQGQINSHFGVGGASHPAATTSVNGFMSSADKTKLDGVATGANNYSHPNHSGDVTSVGDGVQTIANDVVTNPKLANMATATLKGRVTAGTGDPEDLTGTQATTLLDTFTSGLKGLVPPSGGGTTNFLRADGTFAAPAGGGGGSSLVVDASPANPANDTTLNLSAAERTIAPDIQPQYIDNYGRTYLLESSIFNKKVWKADPLASGTTFQNIGGATVSATGTATANALNTTNFYGTLTRVEAAVTTAAVGAVAGFRTAQIWFRRGGGSVFYPYQGGFRLKIVFGIGRGAVTTDGTRVAFAGAVSSTAAPTNVDPATINNSIGIGHNATDTNWHIITKGTGTANKIDTGIAKSIGTDNQGVYELDIFARTSNLGPENVIVGFKDITNGYKKTFDFIQEISTNLPAETIYLGARAWCTSGTTSSVMGLTVMDMTVVQENFFLINFKKGFLKMIELEHITKLWPIFVTIILTVGWFIRLEAKVLNIEAKQKSDVENLKAKQSADTDDLKNKQLALDLDHDKLEEKMWSRFDSIHKMFSEISTKLTRVETIIEERTKDGHL